MNRLDHATRALILSMLVEGSSMRSIQRTASVSFNTVSKFLSDAGTICGQFHNENVRNVNCALVQCDEIWSFCYAKDKNISDAKCPPDEAGSLWTWTAFDPDSKLMVSYWLGDRDYVDALIFLKDLKLRLGKRIQISTDGLTAYREAMGRVFGTDVDFAQTIKRILERDTEGNPKEIEVKKRILIGEPIEKLISTRLVERQNLNMRMGMRRYTRKTNGFSKKYVAHFNMLNIYYVFYNFCRKHTTTGTTPAVAAGLADAPYPRDFIVDLLESDENEIPRKRGPYKKRRKVA